MSFTAPMKSFYDQDEKSQIFHWLWQTASQSGTSATGTNQCSFVIHGHQFVLLIRLSRTSSPVQNGEFIGCLWLWQNCYCRYLDGDTPNQRRGSMRCRQWSWLWLPTAHKIHGCKWLGWLLSCIHGHAWIPPQTHTWSLWVYFPGLDQACKGKTEITHYGQSNHLWRGCQ